MHFLSLSEAPLLTIFAYVDVLDLLHCVQLCKYVKSIIDQSMALQFKIELFGAGLIEHAETSARFSTSERYNALRRRQAPWTRLEEYVPPYYSWDTRVHVTGRLFCRYYPRSRALSIMDLDKDDTTPIHHSIDFGANSVDIVPNPQQRLLVVDEADLLVVVEPLMLPDFGFASFPRFRFYLKTLSNPGQDHPDAVVPIFSPLVIPLREDPADPGVQSINSLQVVGDIMAFEVFEAEADPDLSNTTIICIYNWKSGVPITRDLRLNYRCSGELRSFMLLSESAFVVAAAYASEILPVLNVYSFDSTQLRQEGVPRHVSSFFLPTLSPDTQFLMVVLSRPSSPSHPNSRGTAKAVPTLATAPFCRTLTLAFQVRTSLHFGDSQVWHICMLSQVLLRHISAELTNIPHLVPWGEWGPPWTRWFRSEAPMEQHSWSNVIPTSVLSSVMLMDFNPNAVRGRRPPDVLAITEPTVIPRNDFFASDVESRLPYTSTPLVENAEGLTPDVVGDQIMLTRDQYTGVYQVYCQ